MLRWENRAFTSATPVCVKSRLFQGRWYLVVGSSLKDIVFTEQVYRHILY